MATSDLATKIATLISTFVSLPHSIISSITGGSSILKEPTKRSVKRDASKLQKNEGEPKEETSILGFWDKEKIDGAPNKVL